ncbi:MAG: M23 family metallopeptidase [Chitinispirillales bacterium]|nr:M23 family metallopeptidase [Chitinispirillales bacterium]
MRRNNWSLIASDPCESGNPKMMGVPGVVVLFLAALALVGLAGFARLVYVSSNYALAAHDTADARRENGKLKLRIASIERFVKQEADVMAGLIAYEDNARLKYGLEAISADVRKAGVGGLPSNDDILFASMFDPLLVKAESLRMQALSLNYQAELQESTFSEVSKCAEKMRGAWDKRPSTWPINGARITSTFGYRDHPILGRVLLHEGLDLANTVWTPIYAPADGKVEESSFGPYFGNVVKIEHDSVYTTVYGHMQKAAVIKGQFVKRGDLVGYVGTTGRSTGPHLHYEVHKYGKPVDPMGFIVTTDQTVD